MNPTPGDVHVNAILTNLSVAFIQDRNAFVAAQVFPFIPVSKQSNLYYRYNRDDFWRDEAKVRAPGTESAGGGYNVDTDSYFAKVTAFHKDISDEERGNTDQPLDPDIDATEYVTQKCLIKRETDFITNYMTGGVWTNDYDGVAASAGTNETLQWSDANSDPIGDVNDAIKAILENTGKFANTLTLGYEVYTNLINHPDIIDRVKYTQNIGSNGVVKLNATALANLFFDANFGQGKIVIASAIKSTALEGATGTADDRAFIVGKKALLTYSERNPGIRKPSAGYTFGWTGYMGASAATEGSRIKKFRMENIASDRIEAEMAYAQKVVSADLGFFWDSIVA